MSRSSPFRAPRQSLDNLPDRVVGPAVELLRWLRQAPYRFSPLLGAGGSGRAGFIEQDANGQYLVHDLYENAPDYVQRRMAREAERQAKGTTISEIRKQAADSRWSKSRADGCNRHATDGSLHA